MAMQENDAYLNIKRLRKERSLTQEGLAARISEEVSIATISKLEKGQMALTTEWIDRIAKALGVTRHDVIASQASPVRFVPIIGLIAAGNWSEAIEQPDGWMPVRPDVGGPNCFALKAVGDSMDQLIGEGGYIVVDPDQQDLFDAKVYAVRNTEGETTFKRYQAQPPTLLPCSGNDSHKPIPLGREPFTVVGRVTWAGWPL